MRKILFDLESDNLLDGITKIHCIAAIDLGTRQEVFYGPEEIDQGLNYLAEADWLCGHNVINFDLQALLKVWGWKHSDKTVVRDTSILARLYFSDLEANDLKDGRESVQKLNGGHSLDDWGIRLGERKINFEGPWDSYTESMGTYCRQDVRVNVKLYDYLMSLPQVSEEVIQLEHDFAWLAEEIHRHGFRFDTAAAEKLYEDISNQTKKIAQDFKQYAPDVHSDMKKAAYWVATWPTGETQEFPTKGEADKERKVRGFKPKECSLVEGPKRQKVTEFNIGSRPQVRKYLLDKYGWISPELTETGEKLLKEGKVEYTELAKNYGSVSEDILRTLEFPEAEPIADYLLLVKRQGQIKDGECGWLKLVTPEGRIHHSMMTIGCATFRVSHSRFNISQTPAVMLDGEKKPVWGLKGRYGAECRSVFKSSEGRALVGSDLSGIEARQLAHYLCPFDQGKYIEQVLCGDVHAQNAEAINRLAGYQITRGDSKTPFYLWCYGGGHEKAGKGLVATTPSAKSEFLRIQAECLGGLTSYRASEIASLVRWGIEEPIDPNEGRFNRTRKSLLGKLDLKTATWAAYSVVGGRVDYAFQQGIEGMGKLLDAVKQAAKRGYLTPLDARRVPVRSEHSSLNTLLQSSAAIIARRWCVSTFQVCKRLGIDANPLVFSHDEIQADVRPEHVESYKEVCLSQIRKTGEFYRLAIPLDGETKTGHSWFDTH